MLIILKVFLFKKKNSESWIKNKLSRNMILWTPPTLEEKLHLTLQDLETSRRKGAGNLPVPGNVINILYFSSILIKFL